MIRLILCVLALTSCSGIQRISPENKNKVAENIPMEKRILPEVQTFNGKVKFVSFTTEQENGKYQLKCEDKYYPVKVENKKSSVYLSESYFDTKKKQYSCFLGSEKSFIVLKENYPYKTERLKVDKKRVFLSKKDQKRAAKERVITGEIYKAGSNLRYFIKPFIKPLNSFITSHYGNRRLFNNKKQSQHLGNDFRARTPIPIPTSNRGRIAYTGDLFYSGNTVIVDHGMNIFTTYGHLSKIHVRVGDIINQGDIVGLSGRTGRVSGPHLHWGVKVAGSWVDGFSLIKASEENLND